MLKWVTSFDQLGTINDMLAYTPFSIVSGTPAFATAHPRTGANGLRLAPGDGLRFDLEEDAQTVTAGIAVYLEAYPSAADKMAPLVIRDTANNPIWCITIDTGGYPQLRAGGPTGTVVYTSSLFILLNTHAYLEIRLLLGTIRGYAGMRLEEEIVGAVVNYNTAGGDAAKQARYVSMENLTGAGQNLFLDDAYFAEGDPNKWFTYLGSVQIHSSVPTSGGSAMEFQSYSNGGVGIENGTPGGINNHDFVDEVPPDDNLTYVEGGDHNLVDRYKFTFPSFIWAHVMAATVHAVARREGSQNAAPQTGAEFRWRPHAYGSPVPLKGMGGDEIRVLGWAYKALQGHMITNHVEAQAFVHETTLLEMGTQLYRPLPNPPPSGGGV